MLPSDAIGDAPYGSGKPQTSSLAIGHQYINFIIKPTAQRHGVPAQADRIIVTKSDDDPWNFGAVWYNSVWN
jgi:hypothetical protein